MDDKKLKDTVNRSGFPLQIRTAGLVDETTEQHGWKVLYSEHAWQSGDNGGFIDLVLVDRNSTAVLVVECKRVLDTTWVFLIPTTNVPNRKYCKSWVARYNNNAVRYFDWHELAIDPASPQAAYCIVDGEDPKSKPMLERVAAEVVAATEALAREEQPLLIREFDYLRLYFGVIVTTATLKICSFDPATISISDGKIDDANFIEVPYVRFHKQLSTGAYRVDPTAFEVTNFDGLTRAKENTIFVVNAEHLPQFLSEFEWDANQLSYLKHPRRES